MTFILSLSACAWITAFLRTQSIPEQYLGAWLETFVDVLWFLSSLAATVFSIYYALRLDILRHRVPRLGQSPRLVAFLGSLSFLALFFGLAK
jgi:hypothetical protein